ncbi:glycoside hydrolase superfamily [Geranomyces variabilis]|nr:glycoside hydrolase superfamily [Geranomyces variabilis]
MVAYLTTQTTDGDSWSSLDGTSVAVASNIWLDLTIDLDLDISDMARLLEGRDCCSSWGACGFAADRCSLGCQTGCSTNQLPYAPCDAGTVVQRIIGIYDRSAYNRAADKPECALILPPVYPDQINMQRYTHIFYAAASINPTTFQIDKNWDFIIVPGGAHQLVDDMLINRLQNQKRNYPGLKTLWTIGGPGNSVGFAPMVSTAANRDKCISDVVNMLTIWGFDGVNFDWQFPASSVEGQNYLLFLKELKTSIQQRNRQLIVTITAPAIFANLKNFPIDQMQLYVDWINILTYNQNADEWADYSGLGGIYPTSAPASIQAAITLFLKAGVLTKNVAVGLQNVNYSLDNHL